MDIVWFRQLSREWGLGSIVCPPAPLTGGLMHRMYSLFTEKGKFAVKLLNPHVMQRKGVMENYRTAEFLEATLEQHGIPMVPALRRNEEKMQVLSGQYFYLYEWCEGKALKAAEITPAHSRAIGRVLADIHGIDRRQAPLPPTELHIDWDTLIDPLEQRQPGLFGQVAPHRALLQQSQERGNRALHLLPPISAICHNDMDCKNVLWHGMQFRIIDLECLSFAHPALEAYETALCWAGYETGPLRTNLLEEFLRAYREAGGSLDTTAEILYDANCGRLAWLAYNLQRAQGLHCMADEIPLGVREAHATMAQVLSYLEARESILPILRSFAS